MNEREQIQFLAAMLRLQHNGKLPMLDCVGLAEGALYEAAIVDSESQQRKLVEEKAAKPKPQTEKIQ